MAPSPSILKKRCWSLLLKDVKECNAVNEGELLSSFRKRYTSARKLTCRPAATCDNIDDILPASDYLTDGTVCVDLQFTGPQPIEGSAGLLCSILEATFVAAKPVQKGRGRKRKIHPSIAASLVAPSLANKLSRSSIDGTSGSFFRGMNSGALACSLRSSRSSSGETVRSTASTGTDVDTTSSISGGSSDTASNASTSTSLDDLPDGFAEEREASAAAFGYAAKRKPQRPPNTYQEAENSLGGSDFTAFAPAFGGTIPPGNTTGRTGGDSSPAAVANDPAPPLGLGPSYRVMATGADDLPEWDDVLRGVDSPSCSSSSSSSYSSGEDEERRQQRPSLNNLGEEAGTTAAATAYASAAATCTSLPLSTPGLAAGRSYYECKQNMMASEEAESLFVANTAATTKSTATAPTTADAEGDDLWDMIPDENDSPTLGRHSSSCWALHPVHAGTSAVANDAEDSGAGAQPDDCDIAASAPPAGGMKPKAAGHGILFGWREEECDFDGRPTVSSLSSLHRENDSLGSLAFHGLQSTAQGYDLRDLAVKAKFFTEVQGSSVAEREASPLEVDASGQARSTVTYPSIQEIWPVVYSMSSITAIEVHMVVEVRSRDGDLVYTGPTLRVLYRRPATRAFQTTVPMA